MYGSGYKSRYIKYNTSVIKFKYKCYRIQNDSCSTCQ